MTLPIYPVHSPTSPTSPDGVYDASTGSSPTAPSALFGGPSGSPSAPEAAQPTGSVGSPSAPAAAQAAGSVGSPTAPGVVQDSPVTGTGAIVSGTTSPDVSGLLIDAGPMAESAGVHAYSSDGNTVPASTGRWTILRWITAAGVALESYFDGEQDVGWGSLDAGADTAPTIDIRTVTDWDNYYFPEATGSPVVAPLGVTIPAAVHANYTPTNPTAPGRPIA